MGIMFARKFKAESSNTHHRRINRITGVPGSHPLFTTFYARKHICSFLLVGIPVIAGIPTFYSDFNSYYILGIQTQFHLT